MGTKRSKVHPSYKKRYRVTNWAEYDRALRRRGDITIWLSPAAILAWSALPSGNPGGQRKYSDIAIEAALALRMVFQLPWRQTEGLLQSVLGLMGTGLGSPDHTTLSRRSRGLNLAIPPRPADEPLHVIIDATGLKVFGRGQWATAKHGAGTGGVGSRKFHVVVNESGRIVACDLTEAEVPDAAVARKLLEDAGGDLKKLTADGGYDRLEVYLAAARRGATVIIPPRSDAAWSDHPAHRQRNKHRDLRKHVGKRQWRVDTGHHKQARVENTIGRYKRTFGRALRARSERGQAAEVTAGCLILNRMSELGMPASVAIGSRK